MGFLIRGYLNIEMFTLGRDCHKHNILVFKISQFISPFKRVNILYVPAIQYLALTDGLLCNMIMIHQQARQAFLATSEAEMLGTKKGLQVIMMYNDDI